jgi:hypothetical protein
MHRGLTKHVCACLQRSTITTRQFNVYRSVNLHSDDEGDDHHHFPKTQPKKGDFMSRLPPIMPPNDPRIYQLKEVPEPNENNIIHAKDRKNVEFNQERILRLEFYANRLRELLDTVEPQNRLSKIEIIMEEMHQEGLTPDEKVTHVLNLLQTHREETKEEKIHRESKSTTKKQTDPDFFEPLREKPQNIKTKRHSSTTIEEIFKTRGFTHEQFKKHLQEEERKRPDSRLVS